MNNEIDEIAEIAKRAAKINPKITEQKNKATADIGETILLNKKLAKHIEEEILLDQHPSKFVMQRGYKTLKHVADKDNELLEAILKSKESKNPSNKHQCFDVCSLGDLQVIKTMNPEDFSLNLIFNGQFAIKMRFEQWESFVKCIMASWSNRG